MGSAPVIVTWSRLDFFSLSPSHFNFILRTEEVSKYGSIIHGPCVENKKRNFNFEARLKTEYFLLLLLPTCNAPVPLQRRDNLEVR